VISAVPPAPIQFDGRSLTLAHIAAIGDGATVTISAASVHRMALGRAVIERYLRESIPAYGLTTGLGMRAGSMLTADQATDFSYRTVRGRAQALGAALPQRAVRAIIAARLNTMLDGTAGASAAVAPFLADLLHRGVVPYMPTIGSIGSGDLVAMASLAHTCIGEGRALIDGTVVPAAEALSAAGLEPLQLQPKDGTVLCNNTAFSTGLAALACHDAGTALQSLQIAGALSIAAFGGNATPFDPHVLRARPQAGQVPAGDQIAQLLAGTGPARRLQDPLSMRCIAQVHGAAFTALDALEQAVLIELNSSPDNPAVLIEQDRCVSTGNFHLSHLSLTLDGAARALAWCANESVSRVHRLCTAAITDLPPLLSSGSTDRAGFGPLLKPLEDLRARIIHLSEPVPVLASHNADGIEDSVTFASLAAGKLDELLGLLRLVVAFELVAASQAVDLRDQQLPAALQRVHRLIRSVSPFIDDDRPLAAEIQTVGDDLIGAGRLIDQAYNSD
jgi:histidine ammonia-lyase